MMRFHNQGTRHYLLVTVFTPFITFTTRPMSSSVMAVPEGKQSPLLKRSSATSPPTTLASYISFSALLYTFRLFLTFELSAVFPSRLAPCALRPAPCALCPVPCIIAFLRLFVTNVLTIPRFGCATGMIRSIAPGSEHVGVRQSSLLEQKNTFGEKNQRLNLHIALGGVEL